MFDMQELTLFDLGNDKGLGPILNPSDGWEPRPAPFFSPRTIILARGSQATSARRRLARQICDVYSAASVVENETIAHSQVGIKGATLLDRHYLGKETLVLGELKTAVRYSEEKDNTCPNYWHFSPYGFCPYNCHYCYLAGTPGVKFSPTVKIYTNLPEILAKVEEVSTRQKEPTGFYLGKLQDALALDPLTGYSRVMIPFFTKSEKARLILLTKSANVANLLDLRHGGHTTLSWSLNSPAICREFERNTPSVERRIRAMEACAAVGYPIRAVIMPLIPVDGWKKIYAEFLSELLQRVSVDRLTLGGICSYRTAHALMERKLQCGNAISRNLVTLKTKTTDGRLRYSPELRTQLYSHLVQEARRWRPDLTVSLCLEENRVWESTAMSRRESPCNCLL